jgi:hypothetical protein
MVGSLLARRGRIWHWRIFDDPADNVSVGDPWDEQHSEVIE